ncbi:MAG: hypothetical protein IJ418_16525 [Clostridia bacterium]|nr:hypothetical protein [Clostridia bacterium]
MGVFWILVGGAYIAYKLFVDACDGDGQSAIIVVLGSCVLILGGLGYGAGSENPLVRIACRFALIALFVAGLFFAIRHLLRKWKKEELRELAIPCEKVIDDALWKLVNNVHLSESVSNGCAFKIRRALHENRFPEILDMKLSYDKLLVNNPEVMTAHQKLIELGVAYPDIKTYSQDEMMDWFSGKKINNSSSRFGGFCSNSDGLEIKAELTHLGIDYSRYDSEEIERRKRAEEQRVNATFPHRSTIDAALYQEIDALLLSGSMSEACRSKIRMALRGNRFPELFDLKAVFTNLVKKNPQVYGADINLKLLKFEYPEISSYTHEEMQEWFDQVGDDELVAELTRLGADLSPYSHNKT